MIEKKISQHCFILDLQDSFLSGTNVKATLRNFSICNFTHYVPKDIII